MTSSITGMDSFGESLKAKGYNVVNIRNGEVNFTGYVNALSDNLKSQMVFTDKEQFEIRDKVAALFGSKNNMTHSQLKSQCQKLGLKVDIGYQKTSYIIDNRNSKSKGTDVTNGSVAVITITDPTTNKSIKIVDANGNGAIEIEEMFANELLSGIAGDIQAASANSTASGGFNAQAPGAANVNIDIDALLAQRKTTEINKGDSIEKELYGEFQGEVNIDAEALLAEEYARAEGKDEDGDTKTGEKETEKSKKEQYLEQGYKVLDKEGLIEYVKETFSSSAKAGSTEYQKQLDAAVQAVMYSYSTEELSDGSYAILK